MLIYIAVDSTGKIVDFYVSETLDKHAAKKYFRKALKSKRNRQLRVITTDKYSATELAILEEKYFGDLSCRIQECICTYAARRIRWAEVHRIRMDIEG